jgi:DUF4097 and DUF4098 domain-containing protein YvlB
VIRHSALALVLLAAGSAQAADRSFDRTFTVTPGSSLMVDADAASVRVTGGDSNQVVVHMKFRGSDAELEKTTMDATQSGDTVTVTMRRKQKGNWFSWGSWSGESNIEVTVPTRFAINVRTGGGGIDLQNTVGAVDAHTSGGDIAAKNLTGQVRVHTSGGGIHMDTIHGDLDADTSGGDVRVMNIDGKIKAHTSGGNVRVSLTGANRGITATTSGGDIELTVPRGTTGNVEATTSGGDISSDMPLMTSSQKEGRLEGTLNGGGLPIEAHTSGGSIRLHAGS